MGALCWVGWGCVCGVVGVLVQRGRGGGRLVITLEPAQGNAIDTVNMYIHWPRYQLVAHILYNVLVLPALQEHASHRWHILQPPHATLILTLCEQLETFF